MTGALLYQPRQSWRVAIAFGAAALIHFAAIALAAIHKDTPIAEPSLGSEFTDIDIITTTAPTEQSTPPPIEPDASPVPAIESPFPEETTTPPHVRLQTKKLTVPIVKPSNGAASLTLSSARVLALSAPRPEYPYEARRQKITGNGVVALTVDSLTGSVSDVSMWQSTGSPVLDNAAVAAFRRWRFKPGTVSRVKSPITFTMSGAQF
jgi:protein TonB